MSTIQKIAYTGGIVAAAGTGFMLGYYGTDARSTYYTNNICEDMGIPNEYRWIGTIGWVVGIVVNCVTSFTKNSSTNNKNDDDENNN